MRRSTRNALLAVGAIGVAAAVVVAARASSATATGPQEPATSCQEVLTFEEVWGVTIPHIEAFCNPIPVRYPVSCADPPAEVRQALVDTGVLTPTGMPFDEFTWGLEDPIGYLNAHPYLWCAHPQYFSPNGCPNAGYPCR